MHYAILKALYGFKGNKDPTKQNKSVGYSVEKTIFCCAECKTTSYILLSTLAPRATWLAFLEKKTNY